MRVGFIGLGSMGLPMAGRILEAGHELTVWNRTAAKAEVLASRGAKVAASPGDAARGEVTITMVADDPALAEVAFGESGVLASQPAGAVHLSMSTISVALATKLAAAHAERGTVMVAAPVFGRPEAAGAGKLFIAAAGASADIDRVRPLLDAMGQRTFIIGDRPAQAHTVKLAGNFLIAMLIEALGEAFTLVRKLDVDPARFLEFLTESVFTAPIYRNYGTLIVEERFQPAGFRLPLGLKDVRLALDAARSAGVPMPAASLIHDHFVSAMARGLGDRDWTALARLLAENAGLPPRS